jgi:hypothetical protein
MVSVGWLIAIAFAMLFLSLAVSLVVFAVWRGPSGNLAGSIPLNNTENRVLFAALFILMSVIFVAGGVGAAVLLL